MNKALALVILYVAIAVGNNDLSKALSVPAYTQDLKLIESTARELKGHLIQKDKYSDEELQYMMLLNAANQLFDWIAMPDRLGPTYYDVVNKAILETLNNPHRTIDSLRSQLAKTISKVSTIIDLIHQKQESACEDPYSYTCDFIIDIAVRTSSDNLLKEQSHLLVTLAKETRLFVSDYANEFSLVANKNNAPEYLINGVDRLQPLYMAGGATRKEGQPIIPFRRSGNI